jgi:hypothetical protein
MLSLVTLLAAGQLLLPNAPPKVPGGPPRPRWSRSDGRYVRTGASDYAFFEFAPASGAGMGAECACAAVTGAKGEAMTFTRASVGYCTKSDYTLVQCTANQPRVMPGRPGVPLGYLQEKDATNLVLQNSDLAQATWTKSASMACTKTATGPDGLANSASRCTTSAATQTVTQALVRASSANTTSAYIRRQTGTGGVRALDVSGAYQVITSSVDTNWKRLVCRDTEGCMGGRCIVVPSMCATTTNPSVGFQLDVSGDAIDIALVQNEPSLRPSSPIATVGAAATRLSDLLYLDRPSFTPVSVRINVVGGSHDGNEYALMLSTGAAAPFTALYGAAPFAPEIGNIGCTNSATSATASAVVGLPAGGVASYSCNYAAGGSTGCASGRCETNTGGTTSAATRIYIGSTWAGSVNAFQGVLSNACVGVVPDGCRATSVLPSLSAGHIAWLGDSLTQGTTTSHPIYPAGELYRLYGQYQSRQVMNWGFLGYGLDLAVPKWDILKTSGYGGLVVLLGVNDLRVGVSAATIWSKYGPMLDEAKALGWNVTPVKVTCWSAWSEWTAGKQTETDTLNANLQSWCTANGATCVDTSSMCTGQALSAAYNFGDGLHFNAAGATQLATLVAAANP